ncbi:hypothetical protein P9139_11205 [Curtobacterium flaccumfaciens]|nr:hypothetical protein P9139_11205 [Curtobacterium flaccumfaciens]
MRSTAVLCAAGLLVGLATLAVAGPAHAVDGEPTASASAEAGLGIRLLDVPREQAHDPRAREYITESAEPGTVVHRRLRITNTTGSAQDVRLYTTAATISGGAFDVSRTDQNELSRWTTLDRADAVVHDDDSVDVGVDVVIPRDASGGERFAVIWAEMRSGDAGAVRLVNRVGVREYIDVTAGQRASPDFAIGTVESRRDGSGVPIVVAKVRNTGSLAVDLTGRLTLSDGPGMTTAGPFSAARTTTLAAGQTSTLRFRTSDALPQGSWTATVTAQSGTVTRTATAKVVIESAGTAGGSGATVRIAAAIGVALVVAVTVTVLIRRRRRGRTTSETTR